MYPTLKQGENMLESQAMSQTHPRVGWEYMFWPGTHQCLGTRKSGPGHISVMVQERQVTQVVTGAQDQPIPLSYPRQVYLLLPVME